MTLATVDSITPELPDRVTLEQQLMLWRDTAELAKHLASTEFVPSSMRNKPESVTAAILRAHELGISPLQGLAQIHVINGRPGLAAELMRALVLAHGHEIWTDEFTQTRVTLCGRRAGTDHVEKVTWTLDDAKRAKLGGDAWAKYPRAMLLARATGELCRLKFADILAGMSYTVEELEVLDDDGMLPEPEADDPPAAATGTTRKASRPTAKARGAAKKPAPRKAIARSTERPPLPDEDDEQPIDTTATDGEPDELVKKRAQQIAMKANAAGVDRAVVIAVITNGQKSSAKAVTAEEASQVLSALNDIIDGRAQLVEDADCDPPFRIEAIEPGAIINANDDDDAAGDDRADADEFEWSGEQWLEFLTEHGVTKPKLLREASSWCKEHGEDAPTTLDGLRDRDELCVHLRSWVESQ